MTPQVGDIWQFDRKFTYLITKSVGGPVYMCLSLDDGKVEPYSIGIGYNAVEWRKLA